MAGEASLMDPGYVLHGGCARCLNGSTPLRNTEIDVEYEPAVALCEACVVDLAQAFGLTVTKKAPKK